MKKSILPLLFIALTACNEDVETLATQPSSETKETTREAVTAPEDTTDLDITSDGETVTLARTSQNIPTSCSEIDVIDMMPDEFILEPQEQWTENHTKYLKIAVDDYFVEVILGRIEADGSYNEKSIMGERYENKINFDVYCSEFLIYDLIAN